MDDQLLIQGCLRGDLRAQKQLYEKYAPTMMGICLRYVGDKELSRRRHTEAGPTMCQVP